MVATLPMPSPRALQRAAAAPADIEGLAAGWALLHEAGEALADLAQLGREPAAPSPYEFAQRAAAAGPVRLSLCHQGIDDCAAALRAGITALIAAGEQGRDCTAAALTLWREFDRARAGLLALAAPLN